MSEKFPRLLVATEFPPNASGGGPAVVRQMLKDWPAEKLFWWSCLPDADRRFGQKTAGHAAARIPQKLYPNRRWCGQKSWILEHLWTPWAVRHLRKALGIFQPEAVWVIPHGWSIPPIARVLPAARTGFHTTMQDYMDIRSYAARYGVARSRRLAAAADRLYVKATTRDATSHPMIADLRARTGVDAAQMLHAGIEAEDFSLLQMPAATEPAGKIRIAYAGSIVVPDVFGLFASALAGIRGRLPLPLSLELFGNHSYRTCPWFDASWMNERGDLPAARLTGELRTCTWGFSPMALTDDDPRYNRLSFPTKFISYLAAGLPVITLGHPESSVVKMAQTYQAGLCLTSGEPGALSRELLAGLSGPDAKLRYRPEVLRCARNEFDAQQMRGTLYDCFRKCAAALTLKSLCGKPLI